VRYSKLKC